MQLTESVTQTGKEPHVTLSNAVAIVADFLLHALVVAVMLARLHIQKRT